MLRVVERVACSCQSFFVIRRQLWITTHVIISASPIRAPLAARVAQGRDYSPVSRGSCPGFFVFVKTLTMFMYTSFYDPYTVAHASGSRRSPPKLLSCVLDQSICLQQDTTSEFPLSGTTRGLTTKVPGAALPIHTTNPSMR